MSEIVSENTPPSYDNEQARQFYRTATNPRVLPKKYGPGPEVEVDVFDAAVIAQFETAKTRKYEESQLPPLDELEEETRPVQVRKRALAKEAFRNELRRKDCAVEYIQGVPIEDIAAAGEDNRQMQKEGAFNYILKVAKDGANEIRRLHVEAVPTEERSPAVSNKEAGEHTEAEDQVLEILAEYKDLDYLIRTLHHTHRIDDKVSAQAMILLLELQKSTASPERQIRALYNIRCELERKIMRLRFDQPSQATDNEDIALERGIGYIQRVIGRPRGRISGLRPHLLVKEVDENNGGSNDRLLVRDHVYSHIGYALEKLYPL